jgi:hypothetical protein
VNLFHFFDGFTGRVALLLCCCDCVEALYVANWLDTAAIERCDKFPFPRRDMADDIGNRFVLEHARYRHVIADKLVERHSELSPVVVYSSENCALAVFDSRYLSSDSGRH